MQVSSIRQGQQPSSAPASTSASASSQQYQVELKLPHKATSTITSDLVLWTAGSAPASHAARRLELPFESNSKGALVTDMNLQVLKQPRVFALGDVAGSEIEAETANLPPTAQVQLGQSWLSCLFALQSGAVVTTVFAAHTVSLNKVGTGPVANACRVCMQLLRCM